MNGVIASKGKRKAVYIWVVLEETLGIKMVRDGHKVHKKIQSWNTFEAHAIFWHFV